LDFISYRGTELSFDGDNYLNTPPVKDAFESVKELNDVRFHGKIFLVSRSGPQGPGRIVEWLRHRDFFDRTGVPEEHFYPCGERHEKEIIVRKLGVTHFVDDRAEVLGHMVGHVPNLYLFQSLDEDKGEFAHVLPRVTFVHTWKELLPLLLK
jgi:hypothetical protein